MARDPDLTPPHPFNDHRRPLAASYWRGYLHMARELAHSLCDLEDLSTTAQQATAVWAPVVGLAEKASGGLLAGAELPDQGHPAYASGLRAAYDQFAVSFAHLGRNWAMRSVFEAGQVLCTNSNAALAAPGVPEVAGAEEVDEATAEVMGWLQEPEQLPLVREARCYSALVPVLYRRNMTCTPSGQVLADPNLVWAELEAMVEDVPERPRDWEAGDV